MTTPAYPLTLGSVFRDATPYLPRWVDQVNDLASAWGAPVHVIAVEGDSRDGTYDALKAHPPHCDTFTLLHVEHGGPRYGSVINAQRWKQLALVGNAVLSYASLDPTTFIYVESDLIWDKRTMAGLVHDLARVPAVAPMSFDYNDPTRFYDVWGHVKDGEGFAFYPPYHPGLTDDLTEIDSAGSCFAVRADLVSDLAFSPVDCIRGIGRTIRDAGGQLYLDPNLAVYHP